MTVAALSSKIDYIENGVTLAFAVPFRFLAGSITASRVLVDGTVVALASGVDFSTTGGATDAGGTLTLTASVAGATLRIRRATPRAQGADYTVGDAFPAESHEAALDRAMLVDQEQDDKIGDTALRALMVPDGETAGVLPSADARIGMFLSFGADGTPVMSRGTGADMGLRQDLLGSTALTGASLVSYNTFANYAEGTVGWRLRLTKYARAAGIKGDGSTDDRAALKQFILDNRGCRIVLTDGNYVLDFSGANSGIVLEEVDLVGETVLDGATGSIDQGVNLWIKGTGDNPFKLRRGSTIEGLGFYYPDQVDSITPAVYPTTVVADQSNGAVQFSYIRHCVAYNAYRFFDTNDATGSIGHCAIESNVICALNRGIYIRHNAEHFRINRNNLTFGHWLQATDAQARAYMRANAVGIKVDQSDGIECFDNLIFGHLVGYQAGGIGLCQMQTIALNKFDQVRYPVLATGTGNFDGMIALNTFNAFNGDDHSLEGRSISILTTGSARETIVIGPQLYKAATSEHLYVYDNLPSISAPTRNITVEPAGWLSWGAYRTTGVYGAISCTGANTVLQVNGGQFIGSNNAAHCKGIVGSCNVLIIGGLMFDGTLAALDIACSVFVNNGSGSFNTGGPTSDIISATSIIQTGEWWDKPSGSSTLPAFLARKSAAQTFNSGSPTDVVWGTVAHDLGGNFASPSFTAGRSGRYFLDFSLLHDATGTAGDRWQIILTINGVAYKAWSYKMIADFNSIGHCVYARLVKGDVVKLQVQRVGGAGNFVTHNDPTANWLSGALVS